MSDSVQTWHYGLVARWWAEFKEGGDDVGFFLDAIKRCGQPGLDAGCGTGRLLAPFLRAGLDVDGSDVSSDMLDRCAAKIAAEGLTTNLYPRAMHQLDLPRRYRTVVICGSFGLGGTRITDLEGLRRIRSHLEPGGSLIMDHYPPRRDSDYAEARAGFLDLPSDWSDPADRRRASDGTELELRTRLVAVDEGNRTITREISVREYDHGSQVREERYSIVISGYREVDVDLMLRGVGFSDVRVSDGLFEDGRVIFEAHA